MLVIEKRTIYHREEDDSPKMYKLDSILIIAQGIIAIIFVLSILGLYKLNKKSPLEKKREHYNAIFKRMNFQASDQSTPYLLYDSKLENYKKGDRCTMWFIFLLALILGAILLTIEYWYIVLPVGGVIIYWLHKENEKRNKKEQLKRAEDFKRRRELEEIQKRLDMYKPYLEKCGLYKPNPIYDEHGNYLYDDNAGDGCYIGGKYAISSDNEHEYLDTLIFRSYTPVKQWLNKKAELETHFNQPIIDIRQGEDKQTVELILQYKELPEVINWEDRYISDKDILNVGIGFYGIVGMNLKQDPHCLIAGEPGSGKSAILKSFINQALIKGYEVVLIDLKQGVSFRQFKGIPVYDEHESTSEILVEMVNETKKRNKLFIDNDVDNINEYNTIKGKHMARKIIFIDELAELLSIRDKALSNSLHDSIASLARLSRSAGIHLIMGIQRPDSTIITGQIKSNISFRICGRFTDPQPSEIVLDDRAASKLKNIKGRFIVKSDGLHEIQSFNFVDSKSKTTQSQKSSDHTQQEKTENISEINETQILNPPANPSVETTSATAPTEKTLTAFDETSAVTDTPANKETLTTVDTPANPSVETTSATVESPAELPKLKDGKPLDAKTRKPLNIKSLDDIEFDFSDIKPPKSK